MYRHTHFLTAVSNANGRKARQGSTTTTTHRLQLRTCDCHALLLSLSSSLGCRLSPLRRGAQKPAVVRKSSSVLRRSGEQWRPRDRGSELAEFIHQQLAKCVLTCWGNVPVTPLVNQPRSNRLWLPISLFLSTPHPAALSLSLSSSLSSLFSLLSLLFQVGWLRCCVISPPDSLRARGGRQT